MPSIAPAGAARRNNDSDFGVETSAWGYEMDLHCVRAGGIRMRSLPVVGRRRGESLAEIPVAEVQLSEYLGAIGIASRRDVNFEVDCALSLGITISNFSGQGDRRTA